MSPRITRVNHSGDMPAIASAVARPTRDSVIVYLDSLLPVRLRRRRLRQVLDAVPVNGMQRDAAVATFTPWDTSKATRAATTALVVVSAAVVATGLARMFGHTDGPIGPIDRPIVSAPLLPTAMPRTPQASTGPASAVPRPSTGAPAVAPTRVPVAYVSHEPTKEAASATGRPRQPYTPSPTPEASSTAPSVPVSPRTPHHPSGGLCLSLGPIANVCVS